MIISHRHNYIFVHVPKTGGTSLALALEAKVSKDDILLGDTPKALNRRHRVKGIPSAGRLWKHSSLRDIVGLVPEEFIRTAKVFTIVRNPWDRIVSYYHWLRVQSFEHPAVGLAKSTTFSEFLNHSQTITSFRNAPYGNHVTVHSGQERCDLFLKLEQIGDDLLKLEELLGLKIGPFPHENRSDRGPYQDEYSEEDQRLVAEITAQDIARFGYSF